MLTSGNDAVAVHEPPAGSWQDAEVVDGQLVAETLRRHVAGRYLTCGQAQLPAGQVDVLV
jgi:hypothetical protein